MYKHYLSIPALGAIFTLLSAITVLAALLLAGAPRAQAGAPSTAPFDTPTATDTPQPSATSSGATLTTTPIPTFTPTVTATPTQPASPTTLASRTATSTVTPCPMNFTDVHPTDYFYQGVSYLYCEGAISGYSDNTFRPYNNTTRAQLSKIVVLAEHWPINTQGGPHFSDVPIGSPFYDFVETAYNRQIISGYADGTFRPYNDVTRAQLCKIIVLAEQWPLDGCEAPHFCDVGISHPFYCYILTAYYRGVINGYSDCTFRPYNPATRGQLSKVVYLAVTAP